MIVPYGPGRWARMISPTEIDCVLVPLETVMKWETPEAIDMRYGMEITMYISNR